LEFISDITIKNYIVGYKGHDTGSVSGEDFDTEDFEGWLEDAVKLVLLP
jgi:hypothetical protein